MKKRLLFILFISAGIVRLAAQPKCSQLPTSDKLLAMLDSKPLKVEPFYFQKGCNVNDTIEKKLLLLLKTVWSKNDQEEYINKRFKEDGMLPVLESKARELSKDANSFGRKRDSLIRLKKNEMLVSLKKDGGFTLPDGLFLTVAKLDMAGAKSQLYDILHDSSLSVHRTIVELALARLGDQGLQKKWINACKPDSSLATDYWLDDLENKVRRLCFIATQESISTITLWLNTDRRVQGTSSGRMVLASNWVVDYVKSVVLNEDFRERTKAFNRYSAETKTDVEFTREWLEKNKGKYIINRLIDF